MVFGLFSRKPTQDDASTSTAIDRLPTPAPSIASVTHHSPLRFSTVFRGPLASSSTSLSLRDATESVVDGASAPPPPVTPSPPPVGPTETKTLADLMQRIPPKTLHAYTLARLHPSTLPSSAMSSPALGLQQPQDAPRPPSPDTVSKLTTFFATLAPPPSLHCVRCHKDFYDIENEEKDKACRVPHDDDSALVSRISGGGYETLWGCCGQTASGDGSEGPPDGWCYEGRHTTDIKRARFRADSTIHDDKLTSCLKLNCHGIRDRLPRGDARASPAGNPGTSSARKSNSSPTRSQASRKRPRKSLKEASSSENEADAESLVGRSAKAKDNNGRGAGEKDTTMAVDEPPKSKPKSKTKPKPRPTSLVRPPPSSSTTASLPNNSGSPKAIPVVAVKAKTTPRKPKSTSLTLLSQTHVHTASDSEASTQSRPRTRSFIQEESRSRTTSKAKADASERTRRGKRAAAKPSTSEEEEEDQESDQEEWGRDRKKRRVKRD